MITKCEKCGIIQEKNETFFYCEKYDAICVECSMKMIDLENYSIKESKIT